MTEAVQSVPSLALRAARPSDAELLFVIYASTRQNELARVLWDEDVKDAFLRMQFDAQDRHYRALYPDASRDLVVSRGGVVGRLYVERSAEFLLILDLALLPEHRGRGIGTATLERVLTEGAAARKPVRIYVERSNPAQRLYARLGFRRVADEGVYLLLERPC